MATSFAPQTPVDPQHPLHDFSESDTPQMGGEGLSARYIFAAVRANLRLICMIFVAVFSLTMIVTVLTTPRYQASSEVQVNNSSGRLLKTDQDDDATESASALDTDRFLQTQIDVLNSRGMAERVIKKLNLRRSRAFFAGQGKERALDKLTDDEAQEAAVRLLTKNLTVILPKDSRVIKVSYESTDARLSAMIANTYVSEFIQFNLQRKFESSSYARDFLANQLVEVKKKLEDSERDLNAYSRSAGLIRMTVAPAGNTVNTNSATQQSGSVTTSSLIQVNQAANEAKARRIAIEERWNAISHGPLMSATEVVTNQGIQQLLSQKSVIVSTLEQDKARHLSDYPTVRAEEAQLAAINNQIQNAATSIRNAVKSEYTAAVAAESDLNAQVNGLKSETLNEQDRTVRYGLLAREVDTNREVYDALLQRYKELNASAGISASNIWIIDAAVPPLKASTPDLLKNSVIGFVLALIITATVVVIKDQFDDSIRIPEEIESKLKLTLMGVVPQTTGELVDQMADPKSSFTEAYNSIRGSMLFATSHGLPRSFMVTSAQPGEGKTTTSFALSTALARAGKRVVLIDGDLRRPALHRWVNDDNEQGLSTLLISDASVVSAARPTATANLFVIPAGPIPPSPTEMLSSPRMVEVMREASEVFDVVIIDSAPVLGLADAPMIAAMTEGILFVVEADRTRHGSLKGALRRLVSVRKPIFGAVLTKFDPFKGSNRYGSYYGYEYYQYQYSYHNTDRAE